MTDSPQVSCPPRWSGFVEPAEWFIMEAATCHREQIAVCVQMDVLDASGLTRAPLGGKGAEAGPSYFSITHKRW